MRNDSGAFFHGDDRVHGDISEFIHLPAWPGDYQGIDLGALAEPEVDAWIAGRHVARATLCLVDLHDSCRGQLQQRSNAVAIGFCADQKYFEPMIAIACIVAKQFRRISAAIDNDPDATVVKEVRCGEAAPGNRPVEIRAE